MNIPNLEKDFNKMEAQEERGLDERVEKFQEDFENQESYVEKTKTALNFLDQYYFEESLPITTTQNKIGDTYAAHCFDKNEKGELENHHYEVSEKLDQEEEEDFDNYKLLKYVIHEVRHRLQHEKEVKMFSEENVQVFDKIDHPFFQNIIKSMGSVSEIFKEKMQEREKEKKISENDYDAILIEELSSKLLTQGVPFKEILNIIDKEPSEMKESLETTLKDAEKKEPTEEEKEQMEDFYNKYISNLIDRKSNSEEIPEVPLEVSQELKDKDITIEKFLDYLCEEKNVLLHGTTREIKDNKLEPNKTRSSKIFASDRAAIAMISGLFSPQKLLKDKEGEISRGYPYLVPFKNVPLTLHVNPDNEEIVKEQIDQMKQEEDKKEANGYIYIIPKNSKFKNDPPESWQYYIEKEEIEPTAVFEIEAGDFNHPITVKGDLEKQRKMKTHPSEI